MTAADDYELLDFGDGRKLERFGGDRARSALLRRRRASRNRRPNCGAARRRAYERTHGTTASGSARRGSQAMGSLADSHYAFSAAMNRKRRLRFQLATVRRSDTSACFPSSARTGIGSRGRSHKSQAATGPAAARAESVRLHGRQHAGRRGGRGRSRAHRCGPEHRRPGARERRALRPRAIGRSAGSPKTR